MATITQAKRTLALSTPLGRDVLLLVGFTGAESLSRLFSYQLELASENDAIAAKDIVGKTVSWSVARIDQKPRYFSGIVNRFVAGALDRRKLRTYRAEIVPWTWLLTRTTDCRIYQNQNTPDIITSIFGEFGFSHYKLELKGSFPKREYCVQYRETAFNFISRLMEHEGIFYFFRHENGKHTLVLANAVSSYTNCPESPVEYSPGSLTENHILSWEHHYEFRSGKWSRTDYNFEAPSTSLLTTTSTVIDLPDAPKFEIFDYPGEYFVKGDGEPVTKVRMEEEEAGHNVVNASSQCCTFTPCGKFTLKKHDAAAENGDYVITSISHSASDASYDSTAGESSYNNVFTCIPASVIYRPPRATPKPMVQGVQTAVVTGPPGEEIYVDKYGRVKVQFFWDRKGKKDDKSSCWIRVAEQSAGKGFGIIVHPRIGQEVVVDFLEGDADRPLVTGRVYNAEQMPPYPLPGASVVMGLKSKTHKGSGSNELSFDDTNGKEKITVHGQYDMNTTIEHDQTLKVVNDRTETVTGKHTETITKDTAIKIVSGPYSHDVAGNTAKYHVSGDLTENYDSKQATTVGDTLSTTAKNKITISSTDADIEINGKTHIKLISGDSSIVLNANGTIQISGKEIFVSGTAKVQSGVGSQCVTCDPALVAVSGAAISSSARGKHEITGSLVKIN
jgi:type VI secretion system secreted protein VgrG